MAHQPGVMHQARCKALAWLLQGLLLWRAATLSGMSRGVALANEEKTLIGQWQRAHRLMKNDQVDAWAMASALYGYATQELSRGLLAVDWTDDGVYKVPVCRQAGWRPVCSLRGERSRSIVWPCTQTNIEDDKRHWS